MAVDSQALSIDSEEKIGFRWVALSYLGLANGTVVLFVLSLGVMLPSISDDLELSPLASAYARARGSDRISSLRVVSAVNLAFSQSKLL